MDLSSFILWKKIQGMAIRCVGQTDNHLALNTEIWTSFIELLDE